VLLDSGGVLMRPIGGRWNPRADFEPTVLKRNPGISADQFAAAFAAGEQFMAADAGTPDLTDYHVVMLEHLGIAPAPDLLAELIRPVPAGTVLELFEDVIQTLEALRSRGVRMAVVSDAWSGLPQLHAELGIPDVFEAYAISEEVGCCKPDPRMYRHASDALELEPAECLFVDDYPDLVAAAIDLGYQGRWLRRDGSVPVMPGRDVPAITTLRQLTGFF
jgi:FMN phosphatase YigB (HAD superfamily)